MKSTKCLLLLTGWVRASGLTSVKQTYSHGQWFMEGCMNKLAFLNKLPYENILMKIYQLSLTRYVFHKTILISVNYKTFFSSTNIS